MTKNDALFPADLRPVKAALKKSGDAFTDTKKKLEVERAELRKQIIAAIAAGLTEAEASRLSGVPRKTVRDWQGKL